MTITLKQLNKLKNIEGTFEVKELKNLKNSIYGNPRVRVVMVNLLTNDEVVATTKTDSAIGYNITKGLWNFTYHYTKKGNIIISFGDKLSK